MSATNRRRNLGPVLRSTASLVRQGGTADEIAAPCSEADGRIVRRLFLPQRLYSPLHQGLMLVANALACRSLSLAKMLEACERC